MSNEWDEYANNWDTDPTVEKYANNAFSELLQLINIDGLSVLDFGCGTGALTKLMSPRVGNVVAIDPSTEMIKRLDKKELYNVSTISDYLSHDVIGYRPEFENKFDLIVASSVCSFLPDYESTLTLLRSLLKTDGVFVQWDWFDEDGTQGMGLSKERVERAFEANGFKNINITVPFVMNSSKGTMPVLMAVGKADNIF
ncbi:class I SAM-dependent DNA methyltransferase [Aliivibrio fischeri]|uniref:class I SAM-dependent DNA methyltransferase n=1 Tax=Aliivibrio fischeri TaxID=668 RepID=UPI001F1C0531|nr:class I SAM-dependent methyltransferase [Aliivibrio fischeri]MCE4937532.1 methyltransferase domain-containing protein [Aliivibrio fischeri]